MIQLVKRLAPGIAVLITRRGGQQMWTRVTLRKSCCCAECQLALSPRDHAFSPLTNDGNRADRLCVECVHAAA